MLVWMSLMGCEEFTDDLPEAVEFRAEDLTVELDEDDSGTVVLRPVVEGLDGAPTVAILEPPGFGQLVGSGSVYEYVPERHFEGLDVFPWEARLDGLVSEGTVFLVVRSINDLPVGEPLTTSTSVDVPVSGTVLATDVEDDQLVFQLTGAPTSGVVDLLGDGAFTYTPDAGFTGRDAFLWSAFDGDGASTGLVRVDIDVTP